MKKRTRNLLLSLGSVVVLSISTFLPLYFSYLHHYKGKRVVNNWSSTDKFDINKIAKVEKKKGKDFVILNFADLQIWDLDPRDHYVKVLKEMDYLVNVYKPDLITLTGDQTMFNENKMFFHSILRRLEGYKIPYAPVFGNHDYGNDFNSAVYSREKCCDEYEKGKYSLFSRGPTNIDSLGNYAVNIVENDKIITTLYMMDLGFKNNLTDGQVSWFKWTADGIMKSNGLIRPRGMIFTHKDFNQFRQAYQYWKTNPEAAEGNVYRFDGFSGIVNEDFMTSAKLRGVKDFVAGHYHSNNFSINYEGIRYTFAVKTGEAVYYYEDENIYLNGATTFTINKDTSIVEHHFVEKGPFHFNKP